jgi:hypothetical protein
MCATPPWLRHARAALQAQTRAVPERSGFATPHNSFLGRNFEYRAPARHRLRNRREDGFAIVVTGDQFEGKQSALPIVMPDEVLGVHPMTLCRSGRLRINLCCRGGENSVRLRTERRKPRGPTLRRACIWLPMELCLNGITRTPQPVHWTHSQTCTNAYRVFAPTLAEVNATPLCMPLRSFACAGTSLAEPGMVPPRCGLPRRRFAATGFFCR